MEIFNKIVLKNELGIYKMPWLFCKKINVKYGFKAFGEDFKTTANLTGAASRDDAIEAQIGVRIEDKPGELCPEKRGIHFCVNFSDVLRNRPLKGKYDRKCGNVLVKFRYFYCEAGDVCVTDRFPLFRTNSIVTNAITPLFEIDIKDYAGDISNLQQLELWARSLVCEYWNKKRLESLLEDESDIQRRAYKCIPLYTDDQMKVARIENNDEIIWNYIYRQALNGYVGLHDGKWIVGKYKEGELVKIEDKVFRGSLYDDIHKRMQYLQNHAIYGYDLQNEIFCKFTYDKENQEKYAIHVELVNEYIEGEIMEDSGKFGGIHFVPISHIEGCLDNRNTYYGNKIAIIKPIEEEVYYEYMENVFVGKRVFVSSVMNLYEVTTWKRLCEMTNVIKEKKEEISAYLKGLEEKIGDEKYGECIEFLRNL